MFEPSNCDCLSGRMTRIILSCFEYNIARDILAAARDDSTRFTFTRRGDLSRAGRAGLTFAAGTFDSAYRGVPHFKPSRTKSFAEQLLSMELAP